MRAEVGGASRDNAIGNLDGVDMSWTNESLRTSHTSIMGIVS